ncbi:DUF488 domain-containing protein [Streptomyces sp. WMMC1477]|uniref:DUF488 domain-containing protein n=1 Tax=Streptomyces sp. WMMC1477 TaxID=3015155 RepID=UPI0022B75057|nr:DUF488 family protein [Streptomyces sp. WMMC1477]MCZ7430344.1 DUF488 family protein [Streptomyces sp. WMMC1477]
MESVEVRVRRVYETPGADDGKRVLVDRLWPRGLSRQAAALDAWAKDVAPSDGLRRRYGHDPERCADFVRDYRAELREPGRREAVERLRELAGGSRLTLLTATREVARSHVPVLLEALREPG